MFHLRHHRPLSIASAVFALAVCAGAGAAAQETAKSGAAIDWSILGSLRQAIAGAINPGLDTDADDTSISSNTRVAISAQGRGKRTQLNATIGADAALSAATQANQELSRVNPDFLASALYQGKRYNIGANVQAQVTPVSVSQLEDTGIIERGAVQINAGAGVSVGYVLDRTTNVSGGFNYRRLDFSSTIGNLTPSQSYGVNAAVSKAVTRTTNISLTASLGRFEADNQTDTQSTSYGFSAGISHNRTSRHSLGASLGFNAVDRSTNTGDDSFSFGLTGSASLNYTGAQTNGGLSLTQSIDPSAEGDLSSFTRLSGNLAFRLTDTQSLSLSGSASRRTDIDGGGTAVHLLSVGPRYSMELPQDVILSLGYQFRVRDTGTSSLRTGHQVTLNLSRELVLDP